MNIVIVGIGKVGTTLAEQLSGEDHNVVIIDTNQRRIDELANRLDIMGICGNGANYNVQREAGADRADLLIAATNLDELNMLCCLVAKKLGAQNTIARVRNPEYKDQLVLMKDELGLSMSINPEFTAAEEMFRVLRLPSALKVETFSKGRVEMVELRLTEKSELDGVALRDLHKKYRARVLICVVQRGGEVMIPNGNFELKSGDRINITAPTRETERFLNELGIRQRRVRSVILVGGGRIAYYLARMLLSIGIDVKIIESDAERCIGLNEALPKAMIIHGDGTDQELLLEEGLENTDALAMLTGYDEQNIILSMYAASRNVQKIITKINRPSLAKLFENANGNETVISPRDVTANYIVRYVRAMHNSMGSNVETLHKLLGGRVEALEFIIRDSFAHRDIPLRDLHLRDNLLIAAITRGGQTIIPGGNDVFQPGDSVVVITTVDEQSAHYDDFMDIFAK